MIGQTKTNNKKNKGSSRVLDKAAKKQTARGWLFASLLLLVLLLIGRQPKPDLKLSLPAIDRLPEPAPSLVLAKVSLPSPPVNVADSQRPPAGKNIQQNRMTDFLRRQKHRKTPKIDSPESAKSAVRHNPNHTQNEQAQKTAPSLTIRWPTDSRRQRQLLDYLYQCVGIALALWDGRQLKWLSPPSQMIPSRWLRTVNGHLSSIERQWAPSTPAVPSARLYRVFPLTFDAALQRALRPALTNKPLQSLKAEYRWRQQRWQLHISAVNDQRANIDWPIPDKVCRSGNSSVGNVFLPTRYTDEMTTVHFI